MRCVVVLPAPFPNQRVEFAWLDREIERIDREAVKTLC